MDLSRKQDIAIIGGGVGGCCTALELAKTGKYQVQILEKNSELMNESSDATPGRMGLGFHYADQNTAIYYLHATLNFTKRFSNFRQEIDKGNSHPLRRGRYFIMKNSLVSTESILKTYDALKAEYIRIVQQDQTYQLFGQPDEFYRILEPHEYQNDVVEADVEIGIETAEELLNWKQFRLCIINELQKHENRITINLNTEVTGIRAVHKSGYSIQSESQSGYQITTFADIVVNASWYNISKFNKMLGVTDVKSCNRVKAIATVLLPIELVDAPSMFFCMGSFCMFSNKGGGVGMITYASETNLAVSSSDDFEGDMLDIYFNVSDHDKRAKGQRIINGVSKFIPKMKNAQLVKTGYGVIQTIIDKDANDHGFVIGNLDFLHDPETGGIYKRDYSGVRVLHAGYIVNACMKLLYCNQNAERVRQIIDRNETEQFISY